MTTRGSSLAQEAWVHLAHERRIVPPVRNYSFEFFDFWLEQVDLMLIHLGDVFHLICMESFKLLLSVFLILFKLFNLFSQADIVFLKIFDCLDVLR